MCYCPFFPSTHIIQLNWNYKLSIPASSLYKLKLNLWSEAFSSHFCSSVRYTNERLSYSTVMVSIMTSDSRSVKALTVCWYRLGSAGTYVNNMQMLLTQKWISWLCNTSRVCNHYIVTSDKKSELTDVYTLHNENLV